VAAVRDRGVTASQKSSTDDNMPGVVLSVVCLALSFGTPWKRVPPTHASAHEPTETCVVLHENGTIWCADDLDLNHGVDPEDSY
jgi:hypothetical protein